MESCEMKEGERQSAFGSESGQERGKMLRLLPGLSTSATACKFLTSGCNRNLDPRKLCGFVHNSLGGLALCS